MFTTWDLEMMRANMAWLKELIERNEADADYLEKHWLWLEYVDELRWNAVEAQKILDRYIKLMDELKLKFYRLT